MKSIHAESHIKRRNSGLFIIIFGFELDNRNRQRNYIREIVLKMLKKNCQKINCRKIDIVKIVMVKKKKIQLLKEDQICEVLLRNQNYKKLLEYQKVLLNLSREKGNSENQ